MDRPIVQRMGSGNMDNHGMIGGATFGRKNFFNCGGTAGIGTQTIDGFGRKGYQFVLQQALHRLLQSSGIGLDDRGLCPRRCLHSASPSTAATCRDRAWA